MKAGKKERKKLRPVALSLGGFDPSGGAGVLADIKTFEQNKVFGIAVNTCLTIQNDVSFHSVHWLDSHQITSALTLLSGRYDVKAIKLGMHKAIDDVLFNVQLLKKLWPDARVVWDPVMKSSSGYDLEIPLERKLLGKLFSRIDLVTPNLPELERLSVARGAKVPGKCAVLVKGGHAPGKYSEDMLFENRKLVKTFSAKRIRSGEKHGSGCVLSSAIAANLAKGLTLETSIRRAKEYISKFLGSNETLNGYHC